MLGWSSLLKGPEFREDSKDVVVQLEACGSSRMCKICLDDPQTILIVGDAVTLTELWRAQVSALAHEEIVRHVAYEYFWSQLTSLCEIVQVSPHVTSLTTKHHQGASVAVFWRVGTV
ncbi:hypothetical protein ACM66B_006637 [Microbotryomycetes sp. NB124-2]